MAFLSCKTAQNHNCPWRDMRCAEGKFMGDPEIRTPDSAEAVNQLHADLIDGVTGDNGYAAFTGWSARRCYYPLDKGLLPGGKLGGRYVGSKRRVREYLRELTNGDVA